MSTYDLTGTDADFLRQDVRFAVFEANQRLYLNEPAYANSIEVVWFDGAANPTLVEGVQWRTTYEDRDYAAMSEAKLIDSNFSDILVKSLENLDVPGTDRVYAIQYQALKLKPSEEDPGTDGPNPTPGLLTELINDVNFLKEVKNPLSNLTSDVLDGIKALAEDVTGVNDDNLVVDERHYVNVPNNKMVIRTAGGPFWEHDVVLTNVATGDPLVEGTDYKFIGWDRAKQQIAEHTSHVYNYIFLLLPLVGDIDVTYRAFGGDPTVQDISAIKDVLAEITHILTDGDLLTDEALPYSQTIVDIVDRLNAIDDAVRHYVTATHQIQAETDGLHWFTIANLYRDAWDSQTLKSGQVHLSLRCWTQKWNYDILLGVNITDSDRKLKVETIASTDDSVTFGIGKYDNLADRKVPSIRAIWNDDGVNPYLSGAQIQIGLDMTALQTEVLTVYDRSGSGSDFVIRDHVVGTDTVYDDDVELPNGDIWKDPYRGEYVDTAALTSAIPTGETGWWTIVGSTSKTVYTWNGSVWVQDGTAVPFTNTTNSKFDYQPIFPQEGFLVLAGNVPMHRIQDASQQVSNVFSTSNIPYNELWGFNPDMVKKLTIKVYDRIVDQYIIASKDVEWSNDLVSEVPGPAYYSGRANILFHTEDLCSLYVILSKPNNLRSFENDQLNISFISNIGTHSSTNERFDLREIVVN